LQGALRRLDDGLGARRARVEDPSQAEQRRRPVVERDGAGGRLRVVDPAAVFDQSAVVLAERRQGVAEVDGDLGCGRSLRLQIAVPGDRRG